MLERFSVGSDVKLETGWGRIVLIFAHTDILEDTIEMYVVHQSTDDGSIAYVVRAAEQLKPL